jgi:hypothetical protein
LLSDFTTETQRATEFTQRIPHPTRSYEFFSILLESGSHQHK